MNEDVARRLVAVNQAFYDRFAASFAASRSEPAPGFARLLDYISVGAAVLDVGCSDGRLARFLNQHGVLARYTGVDFSAPLLASVEPALGRFERRDLSRPNCLSGLGQYDLVACLSTLQHIPGHAHRVRLVSEMRDCLRTGGYVALANWQFTAHERQRRKVRPWSTIGLEDAEVESGDYLLSWQRGGAGLRYVALLDAPATALLAAAAGLRIVEQYRSDGREGDLNLYTILAR